MLLKPIVMFVGKARSLPKSGAPERCFTQVEFGIINRPNKLECLFLTGFSSVMFVGKSKSLP